MFASSAAPAAAAQRPEFIASLPTGGPVRSAGPGIRLPDSPAAAAIGTIGWTMNAIKTLRLLGLISMTMAGTPADADDDGPGKTQLITDFTPASADLGWYVLNDNVMGGRSSGSFEIADGQLRFTGRTNTDGGGFSSIRTGQAEFDLANFAGIRLRVRGDGRRYTWRLETDATYSGQPIGYWAEFDTRDDEWQTVDVPFSRFLPRFRGARLDGPPLDTGNITGMGLMIYDQRDGPFELQLASVHAYPADPPFSFDKYRWNYRVLVVSAPAGNDPDFRGQLAAIDAKRPAFEERDMLLVTLVGDGRSSAGERTLAADEVATARAALAIREDSFAVRLIGKDGGVKLASEAPVPMDEVYALIDGMPMRQREMQDR
jgi:NADH dehydrogenase [ubiquinone] 1 alpha subcomplex assembly factor 1